MEKPFTITSFAWDIEISEKLRRAGCKAKDEAEIEASLVALARFLEERGLTTRRLLEGGKLVGGKTFELWSNDLTQDGIAVIRAGLPKWDEMGRPATDLSPLERAYNRIVKGKR